MRKKLSLYSIISYPFRMFKLEMKEHMRQIILKSNGFYKDYYRFKNKNNQSIILYGDEELFNQFIPANPLLSFDKWKEYKDLALEGNSTCILDSNNQYIKIIGKLDKSVHQPDFDDELYPSEKIVTMPTTVSDKYSSKILSEKCYCGIKIWFDILKELNGYNGLKIILRNNKDYILKCKLNVHHRFRHDYELFQIPLTIQPLNDWQTIYVPFHLLSFVSHGRVKSLTFNPLMLRLDGIGFLFHYTFPKETYSHLYEFDFDIKEIAAVKDIKEALIDYNIIKEQID